MLLIHSWWGLTPAFRAIGQSLADDGFTVGLADLFGGATAATEIEARRLRNAPRRVPMYKTLTRNIDALRSASGAPTAEIGVVGYSMGGHWAVWLSQRPEYGIAVTALYYAARAGDFSQSRSTYLAHYADDDPWVSPSARGRMEAAIGKAGHLFASFDYPGAKHWFAECDRAGEYDPSAARAALLRTKQHLRERLVR